TFSFSAVGCEEHRKIDANEPLILTVSPKLWNLLETKANIISDTIKSITFPEFSGKAWIKRTVKVIPDRTRIHLKRTKVQELLKQICEPIANIYSEGLVKVSYLRWQSRAFLIAEVWRFFPGHEQWCSSQRGQNIF
ncbi:hypothetical protein NECAME_01215, partial [Necator americanus]